MQELEDGTVNFLPNRLNHQPVIVRGLTADELWITVTVTGIIGLLIGIIVALFTKQIGLAPTTILICIAAGVFIGGGILRRKKRGRPEMWIYRQLQWHICCHFPFLKNLFKGNTLINRSGYWEIKRPFYLIRQDPKRRPNDPGKNHRKRKKK